MANGNKNDKHSLRDVQDEFASVLEVLVIIGLAILVIGFVIYVTGLLPAVIPVDEVPEIWTMRASEFVEAYPAFEAWEWPQYLGNSDVISFASLVLLACTVLFSFVILFFLFLRRKEPIYAIIVIAEIGILILAASGVLTGGH